MGLTPDSRYSFIVSWDTRARSPLYRSWISRIRGCNSLIRRICRICFSVNGSVTSRTRMVKAIIANPMLLKQTTYNTIKVLSMGRIIISFQRRKKNSKGTPNGPPPPPRGWQTYGLMAAP